MTAVERVAATLERLAQTQQNMPVPMTSDERAELRQAARLIRAYGQSHMIALMLTALSALMEKERMDFYILREGTGGRERARFTVQDVDQAARDLQPHTSPAFRATRRTLDKE